MNRRIFLKSTLAVSALGSLQRDTASAADQPQTARRVKIGFLGASHSHASEKLRFVQSSPAYELIGIFEENERARARYRNTNVKFISQDELLHAAEVIAVESDVKDHARHGKLALEAGKHVHLEKPAAAHFAACQELVRLAREKGRLLQLGFMWRFNPGINAVIEAARKGWLGNVYLVRGTINTQIAADQRPTWSPFPGGTMFELGCHLIDPLIRLMGKPTRVASALNRHGPFSDDLVDNTVAVFEFPRALGIITSATLQPDASRHRSFEVLGTNGTARVAPIEPPRLEIHLEKAAGPYTAGSQSVSLPPYRRYAPELTELARAIATGGQLSTTLEEELAVHEALFEACRTM